MGRPKEEDFRFISTGNFIPQWNVKYYGKTVAQITEHVSGQSFTVSVPNDVGPGEITKKFNNREGIIKYLINDLEDGA